MEIQNRRRFSSRYQEKESDKNEWNTPIQT